MMIPKDKPLKSRKMRESAQGQECTLRITGVCTLDPEKTVLAHPPIANGGWATKASDYLGAFACSECHSCVDRRAYRFVQRVEVYECWIRGHQETLEIWRAMGLIEVK